MSCLGVAGETTNPTGNDPYEAEAGLIMCDCAEEPRVWRGGDRGVKGVNTYGHLLFVTCGGSGLPLHFGGECLDNMGYVRRLEDHLRSITLGLVRELGTQLVDVNILKSRHIRNPSLGVVDRKLSL